MKNEILKLTITLTLFLIFGESSSAQISDENWFKRVLITNDNGIEDPKIVGLARAFAPVAETFVVTSFDDRSGSTHYLSAPRTGTLEAEKRDLGACITAYALDGYPADAVLLALGGIMKNNPPDLVISGINGGPNLAHGWIVSGTIGAARMAALFGIPALAVSGVDDESTGSPELAAAIEWVMHLAQSDLVRRLKNGQYLTVSFPGIPPSKIKGVRVAKRAGLLVDVEFTKTTESAKQEIWEFNIESLLDRAQAGSDAALYQEGYIVVVPMRADEHDYKLLDRLKRDPSVLPEISTSEN